MNRRMIAVVLFSVFFAICAIGLVSCTNDDNTGSRYTVTWKNDNGDVLAVDENVEEGSVPSYNGTTPKKIGTADTRYTFNGWTPAVAAVTGNVTYTATFSERIVSDLVAGTDPVFSQDLKTVQYGYYPQTHVNDAALIAELNALTPLKTNGWYLHNGEYYVKQTAKVYNNESYSFDDGTAIVNGSEYWFKCEPITWNVIACGNGTYSLLSCKLLDARNYYADYLERSSGGAAIYSNNYEQSDIRAWLNGSFYDSAFALNNECVLATVIDNGSSTTETSANAFACANTADKVFLLSYQDYLNADYGFCSSVIDTSAARQCVTTDYARAKGAWCNATNDLKYNGSYWTRSPSGEYYYCAWNVNSGGHLSTYAVDGDSHCVRPCITICL